MPVIPGLGRPKQESKRVRGLRTVWVLRLCLKKERRVERKRKTERNLPLQLSDLSLSVWKATLAKAAC